MKRNYADVVEDIEFMFDNGESVEGAARRAGFPSLHAASRALYRNGYHELAKIFGYRDFEVNRKSDRDYNGDREWQKIERRIDEWLGKHESVNLRDIPETKRRSGEVRYFEKKLTSHQVNEIIRRYVPGVDYNNRGNARILAAEFGISRHYLNAIIQAYRHPSVA